MSKGLKALENIKREAGIPYFSTLYDIDMWREDFATIEKELKRLETLDSGAFVCIHVNRYDELEKKERALEIMKERFYFEWLLCSKNVEQYNEAQDSDKNKLTQEEYELLKEVLL